MYKWGREIQNREIHRAGAEDAEKEMGKDGQIPIVLHHGMFGFGQFQVGNFRMSYFTGVDREIARRGHPLIVSRVHPTGAIARRAMQLKETVLRQSAILGLGGRKLLVLAHSMGGLDARYMISKLAMADRVAALLTVTTPHRGSAYADWAVRNLGRRLGGLQVMNFLGIDVQGILDVTTEACARFNEEVKDAAGVKYFSVSCARPWAKSTPLLMQSNRVIYEAEGDNDGLVSVRSSTWGTHLGVWPADHLHSINKRYLVEVGEQKTGSITPYYMKALERVLGEIEGSEGSRRRRGLSLP